MLHELFYNSLILFLRLSLSGGVFSAYLEMFYVDSSEKKDVKVMCFECQDKKQYISD